MILGNEFVGGQKFREFKFKKDTMPNPDATRGVSSEADQIKVLNSNEPTDPNLEQEGELANLQRVMRDIRYAKLIDAARTNSGSLTRIEQAQITNSLERRKWGGILRNLQKGDRVSDNR